MQIARQLAAPTIAGAEPLTLWNRHALLCWHNGDGCCQLNSCQSYCAHSLCVASDIQGAPLGVAQSLRVHAKEKTGSDETKSNGRATALI